MSRDMFGDTFRRPQRDMKDSERLRAALEHLFPLVDDARNGHEVEHLITAAAIHFQVHPKLLKQEVQERWLRQHLEHHDRKIIRANCIVCHGTYHRTDELALDIERQ